MCNQLMMQRLVRRRSPLHPREADVHRELRTTIAAVGRPAGGRRRIDVMIAAVAGAEGVADRSVEEAGLAKA